MKCRTKCPKQTSTITDIKVDDQLVVDEKFRNTIFKCRVGCGVCANKVVPHYIRSMACHGCARTF